jgi:hypothetical protein
MRTLTVNEVQGVSGGGGPLGAGVGAGLAAVEYIAAHGGADSWSWGSFAVQVGSGAVGGFFSGVTALRVVWGFNGAVAAGSLERIVAH